MCVECSFELIMRLELQGCIERQVDYHGMLYHIIIVECYIILLLRNVISYDYQAVVLEYHIKQLFLNITPNSCS